MCDKATILNQDSKIHRIPAGIMVGDRRTELFGCHVTKKVFGITNGQTIPFTDLHPDKKAAICDQLMNDDAALEDLKHLSAEDALEQYAFCIYGAADSEPDFDENGVLGKPDNFICSDNCRCLAWRSKKITIAGAVLTPREIEVVTKLASDKPAKMIACEMNISESTLDTHKRHLFDKAGVNSTSGLIVKAAQFKVIQ